MFKFFILINFITMSIFSCFNTYSIKNNSSDIKCIKATEVLPFFNNNGKVYKYDTSSVRIYYYKDITLFYLTYHFDSISAGIHHKSEYRNYYFVYKKGDIYGYSYDIHKSVFSTKILVDSILQQQWIFTNHLYPVFIKNEATLISSHQNKDSGTLHEAYSLVGKKDTTMTGNIYLSFTNKISDVEHSLSKELDSLKNMKLYKLKLVINKRYAKEYQMTLDQSEASFWLEELPVTNREEILSYVERYEKDRLKD